MKISLVVNCVLLTLFFYFLTTERAISFSFLIQRISPLSHNNKHTCFCRGFPGVPSYTAITVDTRFGPPQIFSIRHMSCSIPNDWIIMLIAHVSMKEMILVEFSDLLLLGKLQVWELSTINKTLRAICPDLQTKEWCDAPKSENFTDVVDTDFVSKPWSTDWNLGNEIWYSINVLHAIPTQYFLIFQTDGMLCRPLTSEDVHKLRQYDYIGAPWISDKAFIDNGYGGNGGFSFRNRNLLLIILLHFSDIEIGGIEDNFFSSQVHEFGGKLPPIDFAKSFAVETIPYKNPLAFHKPWLYLGGDDFADLTANCNVILESMEWGERKKNIINSCEHIIL